MPLTCFRSGQVFRFLRWYRWCKCSSVMFRDSYTVLQQEPIPGNLELYHIQTGTSLGHCLLFRIASAIFRLPIFAAAGKPLCYCTVLWTIPQPMVSSKTQNSCLSHSKRLRCLSKYKQVPVCKVWHSHSALAEDTDLLHSDPVSLGM